VFLATILLYLFSFLLFFGVSVCDGLVDGMFVLSNYSFVEGQLGEKRTWKVNSLGKSRRAVEL